MKKLMLVVCLLWLGSAEASTYSWVSVAFDQHSGSTGTGWSTSKNSAINTAKRSLGRNGRTGACHQGCLALAVTPRQWNTTKQGFAMRCGRTPFEAQNEALYVAQEYHPESYVKLIRCTWDRN